MTENNYRIDIWRLKQKLYELYPENSTARKAFVKTETLKEYTHLSSLVNLYTPQFISTMFAMSKGEIIKSILSVLVCLLLMSFVVLVGVTFKLMLVKFLTCFTFGILFWFLFKGIKDIVSTIKAIVKFKKAQQKLEDKMNQLQEVLRKLT